MGSGSFKVIVFGTDWKSIMQLLISG